MNIHQQIAKIFGLPFRDSTNGDGGGTGGAPQFNAAEARTFLADFVDNADSLKTMRDDDVKKTYDRYNAGLTKHGYAKSPAAPSEYKLTLPEGSKLSQADIEGVVTFAKANKLSVPHAQMLLNQRHEASVSTLTAHEAATKKLMEDRKAEWVKAIESDKDYGGAKMEASKKALTGVLETFFEPDIRQVLLDTGYSHHPGLFRSLVKIGLAMAEDKIPNKDGAGGGAKDAATILYGKPAGS